MSTPCRLPRFTRRGAAIQLVPLSAIAENRFGEPALPLPFQRRQRLLTQTLDQALALTGVEQVHVKHRPRLLSGNGPAYLSGELRQYLGERGMAHTRGAPYHPQTQGKIERDHRTLKNVVKLQHYYFPWELAAAVRDFVAYYNNERYHESLENVTPADVCFGRQYAVLTKRDTIKRRTMKRRKREYLAAKAA